MLLKIQVPQIQDQNKDFKITCQFLKNLAPDLRAHELTIQRCSEVFQTDLCLKKKNVSPMA